VKYIYHSSDLSDHIGDEGGERSHCEEGSKENEDKVKRMFVIQEKENGVTSFDRGGSISTASV